nr:LOW QUALITY PROTEIN: uncharacterized protein LOC128690088 [Cherax quadricarinatus]
METYKTQKSSKAKFVVAKRTVVPTAPGSSGANSTSSSGGPKKCHSRQWCQQHQEQWCQTSHQEQWCQQHQEQWCQQHQEQWFPTAPGAVVPTAPGAVVSTAPGAVVSTAPGAVVPTAPGAVVPTAPGAVVPTAPGAVCANSTRNSGANSTRNSGVNSTRNSGVNSTRSSGVNSTRTVVFNSTRNSGVTAPGAVVPTAPGAVVPTAPGAVVPKSTRNVVPTAPGYRHHNLLLLKTFKAFLFFISDQGERLSHAVGCAFAACLERKQKRDKECGVTMSFDPTTSTFTRSGSFRQMTVTERLSDPQECKPIDPVPVKKVENPHAIARPHATPLMLQRQGSFRVFQHLSQSSPFKRQLSLRLNDLPSNLERTRSMSLDNNAVNSAINNNNQPPVTPIPESSPVVENKPGDAVSAMCQELSAGLSLLSNFSDPFSSPESTSPAHNAFTTATTTVTSYTNIASTVVATQHGIPTSQGGMSNLYFTPMFKIVILCLRTVRIVQSKIRISE